LASIDRTAYPRSKRVVSARELAEAFTPTSDEVGWGRSKTTTEQHFLALVVLLKCYQRLGYFPKLLDVPVVVVDRVHLLDVRCRGVGPRPARGPRSRIRLRSVCPPAVMPSRILTETPSSLPVRGHGGDKRT
jgi:hypothetical protein